VNKKIVLIILFLITACTNHTPPKILGNWKSVQGDWHARIYKDGNIIILKDSSLSTENTTYEIIKKGKDFFINVPYTPMKISYLKDQDKLIFNGKEWRRVSE